MSEHMFNIPHAIVEQEFNGEKIHAIRLQETPYNDIIISYGRVSFKADEATDTLSISFEYELIEDNDQDYDVKEFENYIGQLLQEIIIFEMGRNNLIFTGGTDDNRKDNSE